MLQLIAFEPMLIIFGTFGIWLAWKRQIRPEHRLMSIWAFASLLINLIRVGRRPEDLIWIVIPLAWLAALALARLIESKHQRQWLQLIVLTCLLLVLAASAYLSVSSYLQGFQLSRLGSSVPILYFIFGALFLMAASLLLIFGMEWSWAVARDALGLAVLFVTMGLSLQATWRLNFPLRGSGARLLWSAGGTSPGLTPLLQTLENASLAESGFPHELGLQVPGDLPAAVAFGLRDFPRASGEFDPGQGASPALLTPESQPDVQLLDKYYGQTFALIELPAWDTRLTPNLGRWWVLNEAPSDSTTLGVVGTCRYCWPGRAGGGWRTVMAGEVLHVPRLESIAIDGPAASGKSTLAERLAEALGFLYFDTGVMYRAVTLAALRSGIEIEDEAVVSDLARGLALDVQPPSKDDGRQYDVLMDGEDVTWNIRTPEVDANVSLVSSFPGVRRAMTQRQREIGMRGKIVMVGRDIGTVVLPEADIKLYLDASVDARARRRFEESQQRGDVVFLDEVLAGMKERDRFDSTRSLAPLRPADDAFVLDSTDLDIEQVVLAALELIRSWSAGSSR